MPLTAHPRSRRALLGAAPVLVFSLVLAGCGRADDAGASSAASLSIDDTPATGTVEIWAQAGEGGALTEFVKSFEAENPDVTVTVTSLPANTAFDAKITAAIASGSVPDVINLYSQTQSTIFTTGGIAPVPTGLVDSSVFFPASYEPTVVNGESYAVPWYAYSQVFYYRSDLAQQAGVEPPQTWEDMKTFAAAIQNAGLAEHGLGLGISWDQYSPQQLNDFIVGNGGSLISSDLSTWTINEPANVEALSFWGTLFAEGYASADEPQFLDVVPFLTSGKVASTNNGPWLTSWLDQANGEGWSKAHIGAVLPPAGPKGQSATVGSSTLAVLKDAKNPVAAWKFVRWMAEPETQLAWYAASGNLPAVVSAWDDPAIADDALLVPVKEGMQIGVGVPPVSTWAQVGAIIGKQMERVARGQATAQQALDEAQQQAEQIGTGTH